MSAEGGAAPPSLMLLEPRAPDPGPRSASRLRRLVRLLVQAEARGLLLHDWRRTVRGEPALPAYPIRNVAIVCTGNLCRSPFAAALLSRAHPQLVVRSFGLMAPIDEPAEPYARVLAREWGCDLDAHRTRPFTAADAAAADLILAMDGVQSRAIARAWPDTGERVRSLGDFLPVRPFAIADPWGQPEPVWRESYDRIARAVERVSRHLEARA